MSLEEEGEIGWVEYEGCRLGIKGRGGAGARGYFVIRNDDAGDVGDFKFATVSAVCSLLSAPAAPLLVDLDPSALLCLRRRVVSSLYSLIRIDRLAGVVSSEEEDGWDLAWLWGIFSFSLSLLPASSSDSDVAEEKERVIVGRRRSGFAVGFRRPFRLSPLDVVVRVARSGALERPTAWVVDLFPLRLGRTRLSLRTGLNGANLPLSS